MTNQVFVSLIIPCRNEERFIGRCLDSIVANDYPRNSLEVLVVDGMSEDRTKEIVEGYVRQYPFIKILDNSKRNFTAGVNNGIKNASGDIIMIVGAHATYEKNYVSNCVKFLRNYNADNAGGILIPKPFNNTDIAKAIALTLSHPFGSGNSHFRIGSKEPRWVDTVFGGCYRKEVFEKIGLFNEELPRSADMDFNARLRKAGGKILLVPNVVAYYYPRSDLKGFLAHNFDDGFWAIYPLKFVSQTFSWRHWIPLVFILSLIASAVLSVIFQEFRWLLFSIIGAYAILNLGTTVHVSIRERHFSYLFVLPIVLASRHFAYGLGSLFGLLLVLIPRKPWKGRRGKDV